MNASRVNVGAFVAGLLFMLIGAVLGADAYLGLDLPATLVWPSLLIAGGIVLLLPRSSR